MDLHPSNEHITTTTTTNINTTTLPNHVTGVQSPVEDSTDGAIVSLPVISQFLHELPQVQPPSNFHVQFLENIVQDAMEELK